MNILHQIRLTGSFNYRARFHRPRHPSDQLWWDRRRYNNGSAYIAAFAELFKLKADSGR
jgi:hypothetical protein